MLYKLRFGLLFFTTSQSQESPKIWSSHPQLKVSFERAGAIQYHLPNHVQFSEHDLQDCIEI